MGSTIPHQLDTLLPVVGLPRQCSGSIVPLRPGRLAMREDPTMSADWSCIHRDPRSSTLPCPKSDGPFDPERLPGFILDEYRRH